jgi:S-DNA-T family DNA segregation ATPase FtsK/SpoIIIE
MAKEKKDNKQTVGKGETIGKKGNFFTDEKLKIVFGVAFVLFASFSAISCISYFFTWQEDQSFVRHQETLSSVYVVAENWAGKFGAKLAYILIYDAFGVASLFLPFLLFIIGLRLLKVRLLPLRKTIRIILFGVILTSLTLGYIGGESTFLGAGFGGAHGREITNWLNAFMGKVGTGLLLLFLIFTYLAFTIKSFTKWFTGLMVKLFNRKPKIINQPDLLAKSEEGLDYANENKFNGDEDITKEVSESSIELIFERPENNDTFNNSTDAVILPFEQNLDTIRSGFEEEEEDYEKLLRKYGPYDPKLDLSDYKLPGIELLVDHKSGNPEVTNEELISNKNKIVETLGNYKIQIDKIKATIGPTVTLYEIVPAPGIRISKIKSLEDDIALSLSALGIRIIAPIPGRGTIGIEVPNRNPEIVSMKSVIASKRFQESSYDLAIVLGKTISNETFVIDLAKMPHLLVAGATGQGKSVGLNAIITSLLYKKHPSELKFILIDPKKVELTLYSKLEKHFLAKLPDANDPIITDTQKVINTLNSLTIEMDNRYDLLKKAHVRNIKEYNTKFIERRLNPEYGHRYLPYIVLIIDEFADLIMTAGREIETPLARLAQLARAIGIHLVIATQRPTTNIITGVIKANFPARIAFRVISMIDSRTILDTPGANQLVGRGDMLISTGSDLIRVQCAYIDISEIDKITDFISSQHGYSSAMSLPEVLSEYDGEISDIDLNKRDGLFEEAARLIVIHQQGSTSLIQRKFSIGYNRAGRIMDQLEKAGIVGPNEGSKARQVLIVDEISLEQILKKIDSN